MELPLPSTVHQKEASNSSDRSLLPFILRQPLTVPRSFVSLRCGRSTVDPVGGLTTACQHGGNGAQHKTIFFVRIDRPRSFRDDTLDSWLAWRRKPCSGSPPCGVARDRLEGGLPVEDLKLVVVDQHGDGLVGVAVADLELLTGDLDAALAGDSSLDQQRALGSPMQAGTVIGAGVGRFQP
jgi:hypothetical protein